MLLAEKIVVLSGSFVCRDVCRGYAEEEPATTL